MNSIPPITTNKEQIDFELKELVDVVWKRKWIILLVVSIFTITSIFYALSLPNVYKSEALLSPVTDNSGLKLPSQLGGLASLAGVNLDSQGDEKAKLALEILKSRAFITNFIEKNDLFVPIMASKGWAFETNELIINDKLYNATNKEWVRKVKAPYERKPSLQETYKEFMKLLSISVDKKTGMVTLSFQHHSPLFAKEILDKLIFDINEDLKQRDLSEAKLSIDYLNEQISLTNLADVRSMLFSLVEEQTKTLMLANIRSEYVFKTIDKAIVTEKKYKPRRSVIVIAFSLFGFLVSITFVWLLRNK